MPVCQPQEPLLPQRRRYAPSAAPPRNPANVVAVLAEVLGSRTAGVPTTVTLITRGLRASRRAKPFRASQAKHKRGAFQLNMFRCKMCPKTLDRNPMWCTTLTTRTRKFVTNSRTSRSSSLLFSSPYKCRLIYSCILSSRFIYEIPCMSWRSK